jgi:hypothetical protein
MPRHLHEKEKQESNEIMHGEKEWGRMKYLVPTPLFGIPPGNTQIILET